MILFVLPEHSSERDYVITHSVRSMYVRSMYVTRSDKTRNKGHL